MFDTETTFVIFLNTLNCVLLYFLAAWKMHRSLVWAVFYTLSVWGESGLTLDTRNCVSQTTSTVGLFQPRSHKIPKDKSPVQLNFNQNHGRAACLYPLCLIKIHRSVEYSRDYLLIHSFLVLWLMVKHLTQHYGASQLQLLLFTENREILKYIFIMLEILLFVSPIV